MLGSLVSELQELSASVSPVLELQVCASILEPLHCC